MSQCLMASIPQDTELVNSWNFRIGSDILGVGVGWKSYHSYHV